MVPNFVSAPELFGPQEIWSLHENVQGHNVQLWVGKFKFCCMLKIIQKRLFQFYPKIAYLPKNCSIGWAKPMVSTCGKFEAKVRQKIEFTSGTSGGSGNEGDAGDEGGIRGDHGGKQEIIINNNYYEKYRNHEQIENEKTTVENVSDTTDNCDATKVLFNLFIETEY